MSAASEPVPSAAAGAATVLTLTDRARLAAALDDLARGSHLLVVGLCAQWCGTCREFRPAFARIAAAQPRAHFLWLDVEDDAAVTDDIDVDNFPTLALYGPTGVLHYGVSLPHEHVVARLIESLLGARRNVPADAGVEQLPAVLRALR